MTNPSNTKTFEERFWDKVIVGNGCWLWTGAKKKKGYGFMNHHGKNYHAHRVSYMIHAGNIPDGMHVLHQCDNPPCVNPAHLFLGTNKDNIDDMIEKGRNVRRPEACWKAKLNWSAVKEIRASAKSCGIRQLALRFGVSENSIDRVIKNQTWISGKYEKAMMRKQHV